MGGAAKTYGKSFKSISGEKKKAISLGEGKGREQECYLFIAGKGKTRSTSCNPSRTRGGKGDLFKVIEFAPI